MLVLCTACVALAASSSAHSFKAEPAAGASARSLLPPTVANAIKASGLSPKSFGIYAQEVIGERTAMALNEESAFTMASTTKIVTSLAALDLLGPYYRWRTSAFAMGTMADGKLTGDLLIVGGGNAQLTAEELQAWFGRMHQQGLREIDGNIVLDRHAFQLTADDHAHTPMQSSAEPRHVWPDAMTLNEGLLDVVVQPARSGRVAVSLRPALSDVGIDNRVTAGVGCNAEPRWEQGARGRATVVVEGSWSPVCGARSISFVPPPDSGFAARALASMWATAGGVLHGRVVSAVQTPGVSPIPTGPDGEPMQPMSFDRSKPLTELVRDINKASDNVGARNLMLSLSPGFPNRPATLAGAQKVIGMWLRDQGLDEGDVEVENGSGLSHSERAKPRAMVQLLRRAWRADQAQAFFDSLPIAGIDGTLKNRLGGTATRGQAYLKTGTLNDTRALRVTCMVQAARCTPLLSSSTRVIQRSAGQRSTRWSSGWQKTAEVEAPNRGHAGACDHRRRPRSSARQATARSSQAPARATWRRFRRRRQST
jgi:D-alanyl-D-alanine carboxypeptidase/D-alanyl-D-alanine-endopeptidase (penicillin-binding protein 4)